MVLLQHYYTHKSVIRVLSLLKQLMYLIEVSISLSHQGPARKLKLIEQGVTIFTKLNDLNAEKILAQR